MVGAASEATVSLAATGAWLDARPQGPGIGHGAAVKGLFALVCNFPPTEHCRPANRPVGAEQSQRQDAFGPVAAGSGIKDSAQDHRSLTEDLTC